jgi:hypothetical protein
MFSCIMMFDLKSLAVNAQDLNRVYCLTMYCLTINNVLLNNADCVIKRDQNVPFKYETQTVLFKDPVRTAL